MLKLKKILQSTGQFFKGSFNIIKLSLWIFVLQIVMSLFSLVLLTTDSTMEWMKLLSVVMLILNFLIIFIIANTTAYSDFQIYKNNYIRINKGETIPKFKMMREYKWHNGLIAGVIACLPSIIMIFIGAMQSPITTDSNLAGKIVMLINFIYMVPVLNYGGSNNIFIIFYGIVLAIAASGIGYYFKGFKLYTRFMELQKELKKDKK